MSYIKSKADLVSVLLQHQAEIADLGVRRCGLFGSFVRGEQKAESDIDFLVEFEPGKKTFDNFMHLAFFLEDILGRKVELVTPESLSPHIGPTILREVEFIAAWN